MVVEKAPIFINSGLCCSIQDGITHVYYTDITLSNTVVDIFVLFDLLS